MPSTGRAPRTDDTGLDVAIEEFDRFSLSLVRLEPCALARVRAEVQRFAARIERHLDHADREAASEDPRRRPPDAARGARLALEHQRFRASVEQLRGILAVVEGEDHGGHRQALGQYGRVLAEALRNHRADELPYGAPAAPGGDPAGRASDN